MRTFELRWKIYRKVALACIGLMLVDVLLPTAAWALTSGPSQPEFSSFEPVSTTTMVNDFSGDFTYNIPVLEIPGLEGGGYSMSLSYHSGTSPEEESSWVGYGWTLNPGAINRQKRGYPDDWNGESVKNWNKTKVNGTVSLGGWVGDIEVYSIELPISVTASLRYNNYRGFGYNAGVGLNIANEMVSLGYHYSDGEGSFSLRVNPAAVLAKTGEQAKKKGKKEASKNKLWAKAKKMIKKAKAKAQKKAVYSAASKINYQFFQELGTPSNTAQYLGLKINGSMSAQFEPYSPHAGPHVGYMASFTAQKNLDQSNRQAYGYMYSENATSDDLMDYTVEKDAPFKKRDRFLPIPFNSADFFTATGEALSGGFRMHKQNVGYYRPHDVTSGYGIANISVEYGVGVFHVEAGSDLGAGISTLRSGGWEHTNLLPAGGANGFSGQDLDNVVFRFTNDPGGYVHATDNVLESASLSASTLLASLINPNTFIYDVATIGKKSYVPNTSSIESRVNAGARVNRSSFIGYNKNGEIIENTGGVHYKAFTKDASVEQFIDRTTPDLLTQLGEFSMVNPAGERYTYGLPVYSRKEKQMAYDTKNSSQVIDNHIVYKNTSGNSRLKRGSESDAPYASTFLLTSIEDADYVDRTNDGPTEDDFGGWTRFVYKRSYGSNNKVSGSGWYKWRIPYTGYTYARNEFSDPDDDIITYYEGEKEVYYLDSIETRTHVAVFNTTTRKDGIDAGTNAGNNQSAQGSGVLQQLDDIKLYAKGFDGSLKLIRTTHFEYSNELMQGLPNTSGAGVESGKLTLKKVWFEYEGIKPAWVNPYEFEYTYPSPDYPTPYNALENYGAGLTENPNYSVFNLDAWGNYQTNGNARHAAYQSWLDQTPQTDFDPAAWQLKVIKLPSGGEIHVQYEQDDYQYVQDRMALSMVSLVGSENEQSVSSNKFYLRHEDLGVQASELNHWADLIRREFVQTDERIYFKYLYKLIGGAQANLSDCNVEFIKGYLRVTDVGVSNYGGQNRVWLRLGKSGNDFNLPRKVCRDFVRTQRSGKLSHNGCSDDIVFGNSNLLSMTTSSAVQFFLNFANFLYSNLIPGNNCNDINHSNSYLRVPNLHPKKGGGIRVKRILMFEDGSATGRSELYGKEYTYEVFDEARNEYISSGVAANEPQSMREENALVRFLPRFKQSFFSKVIAGRDRKQTEGPIGESILPSPSVGYAKVIVQDIHQANETGSGFVTKEFYTSRDYPVTYEMTSIRDRKDILQMPAVMINKFVNNNWKAQGFLFETNNMSGQPRSEKWYGGTYVRNEVLNRPLVQSTVHEYYEPGESIPVMEAFNEITHSHPLGQEIDLTMESKQIREETIDGSMEGDAGNQLFQIPLPPFLIPVPFVSGAPTLTHAKNELYTHVTSKVVTYPVFKKAIVTFRDGVYHREQHLAYSLKTGEPLITQTTDGFEYHDDYLGNVNLAYSSNHNGKYTGYTIPAWTEFETFDQKAVNERSLVDGNTFDVNIVKISSTRVSFAPTAANPTGSVCDAMSNFGPGDLIEIEDGSGNKNIAYVTGLEGNELVYDNTYFSGSPSNFGAPVTLRVIRSGKNNRISEAAGHFTTYGKSQFIDQPTPSGISDPRTAFVNQLNNFLQSASHGQVFYPSGQAAGVTFYSEGIPEGCFEINPAVIGIRYNQSGSRFSLLQEINPSGPLNLYFDNPCTFFVQNQPIIGGLKGQFQVDPKTNLLTYFPQGNDCFPIRLTCLQFCDPYYPGFKVTQVVNSNAVVYGDDWNYDLASFPLWSGLSNRGDYEKGTKGKWRVAGSYSYNDPAVANVAMPYNHTHANKNYRTGMYTMDYFNWLYPAGNGVFWQKDVTVDGYSPDGQALEETDIHGIASAALYGYNQRRPYLIVQNSDAASSYFESFECNYGTITVPVFERPTDQDNFAVFADYDETVAHSGEASFKVYANDLNPITQPNPNETPLYMLPRITLTQAIQERGLEIRFWLKHHQRPDMDFRVKVYPDPVGNPTLIDWPTGGDISWVAQVGEWDLYRSRLSASVFSSYTVGLTHFDPSIYIYRDINPVPGNFLDPGTLLWLDDIILAPAETGAMCYVYDKETFRVTAIFSDAHFATFYQYNEEGKLIRKKIETERGLKTLEEMYYNSPARLNPDL